MVRNTKRTIFTALTFLVLMGCGYHEGVIQEDQKSYLWFTGNTDSAVIFLDDFKPFELNPFHYIDSETGEKKPPKKAIHYRIAPGKHRIIIKKNNRVVVDKVFIVGNGITREIQIP